MNIAITGKPGVGKTTLCKKIWEKLKPNLSISGFITLEIRVKNRRVGFEVFDLRKEVKTKLASVGKCKTMVGKYCVHITEFEEYLKNSSLRDACDLIIIDEIGPMELKSYFFVELIEELLNSETPKLFTIHAKSKHPLLEKIRRTFKIYTIDERNRNQVTEKVLELLKENL